MTDEDTIPDENPLITAIREVVREELRQSEARRIAKYEYEKARIWDDLVNTLPRPLQRLLKKEAAE